MVEKVTGPSVEGRRAAFEKWWLLSHTILTLKWIAAPSIVGSPGYPRYLSFRTQMVWEAWQACDESHRELRAEREELRECLRALLKLIDDGILVRDISRDSEPEWLMHQLPMVSALARASKVLEEKS